MLYYKHLKVYFGLRNYQKIVLPVSHLQSVSLYDNLNAQNSSPPEPTLQALRWWVWFKVFKVCIIFQFT